MTWVCVGAGLGNQQVPGVPEVLGEVQSSEGEPADHPSLCSLTADKFTTSLRCSGPVWPWGRDVRQSEVAGLVSMGEAGTSANVTI